MYKATTNEIKQLGSLFNFGNLKKNTSITVKYN